jgi:hypothetical protein
VVFKSLILTSISAVAGVRYDMSEEVSLKFQIRAGLWIRISPR